MIYYFMLKIIHIYFYFNFQIEISERNISSGMAVLKTQLDTSISTQVIISFTTIQSNTCSKRYDRCISNNNLMYNFHPVFIFNCLPFSSSVQEMQVTKLSQKHGHSQLGSISIWFDCHQIIQVFVYPLFIQLIKYYSIIIKSLGPIHLQNKKKLCFKDVYIVTFQTVLYPILPNVF